MKRPKKDLSIPLQYSYKKHFALIAFYIDKITYKYIN